MLNCYFGGKRKSTDLAKLMPRVCHKKWAAMVGPGRFLLWITNFPICTYGMLIQGWNPLHMWGSSLGNPAQTNKITPSKLHAPKMRHPRWKCDRLVAYVFIRWSCAAWSAHPAILASLHRRSCSEDSESETWPLRHCHNTNYLFRGRPQSVNLSLPCLGRWEGQCKSKLTQLRPLKHLQLGVRVQKAFDCLNVLLVLEPGKDIQVIQRLGQVSVKKHYR